MTPRRRILPLFIPHLGCGHDCVFCSQRRVTGREKPATPADIAAALSALKTPVDEAAFYGGSFTALPLAEQTALLDAAQPFLKNGMVRALRVSTRPDAIDSRTLDLLHSRHVETIELGAQSMDDAVLQKSGRGHTAKDTECAARYIRGRGFHLILQMMTGLPGSDDASDYRSGMRIAELCPEGVRIYPTVILRDTPLYVLWKQGAYREHTVEDAVRICARLLPLFDRAGIPVIRLGLNPTEALSDGGAAGGAYHPALGELVRSRVFLEQARALLRVGKIGKSAVLGVRPADVSRMTGQHRCNLTALKNEFSLQSLRIVPVAPPEGESMILLPGNAEK